MALLAHNLTNSEISRTSDVLVETTENDGQRGSLPKFSDLHLSKALLEGLEASGFTHPSPVQLKAIPVGKLGLDLLVQAKSGTGKTLVFVISALESLDTSVNGLQALVIAPTREIAVQAARVALEVGARMPTLKVSAFIGGMSVQEDIQKLKSCNFATGTPGRIKQLIEEGHMKTDAIRILILDEADKLMEKTFAADVTTIFNKLPRCKQIIAASATFPGELAEVVEKYMRNPTHVRLAKEDQVLQGVAQYVLKVKHHSQSTAQMKIKAGALFHLLNTVSFSQCLVFSNYALRAEALCTMAEERGWPAVFIASTQDQRERLQAINRLKQFQIRVLFSTDLTARGIDAQNINMVINIDVPWDEATYLHRIGRSGRFGTSAIAITIASDGEEFERLRTIVFKTGSKIRVMPDAKTEVPDNFDLWTPGDLEMPVVEGLECDQSADQLIVSTSSNDQPLEGCQASDNVKSKKKKKGKKEPIASQLSENVAQTNEDVIDITKAWVPVEKPVLHKTMKQVLKDPEQEKYKQAKDILHWHLNRIKSDVKSKRICSEPLTPADIDQEVDKILTGQISKDVSDDANDSIPIPIEVIEAAKVVHEFEREAFNEKLEKVSKVMSTMSVREALDFARQGVLNTVEPEPVDEIEVIPDKLEASGSHLKLSDLIKQDSTLDWQTLYDLPNPDPHRLLSQIAQDQSVLQQWLKEVQENSEFIHDMELLKHMNRYHVQDQ